MASLAARLDWTTGITRAGHAEYLRLSQEMNYPIIILTIEKLIFSTDITLPCDGDFANTVLWNYKDRYDTPMNSEFEIKMKAAFAWHSFQSSFQPETEQNILQIA